MSNVVLESTNTSAEEPEKIAEELVSRLAGGEPKLVTVFIDAERDQAAVARAVRARFPKSVAMLSSSTKVPISRAGVRPGTVLAALSGDLEVGIGLGTGLTADPVAAGAMAAEKAASGLGTKAQDLDLRTTVGLVIDDGPRMKKEELLLGVLDANPGLSLVGGGASDTLPQETGPVAAYVGVDGEVATDAVLVAFIRTRARWAAMRHHAYRPTGDRIVITKVDDTYSRALEIDGKPATKAYAELCGVGVDELEFGMPKGFSDRPTAMRVGKEYFLRAPWKPLPDGSIIFANRITENTEFELMKGIDFGAALASFFKDEVPAKVGKPTGALYFNCLGRHFHGMGIGATGAVDEAYASGPPSAGINAQFEIFNGFQINSTLTALAFGEGA